MQICEGSTVATLYGLGDEGVAGHPHPEKKRDGIYCASEAEDSDNAFACVESSEQQRKTKTETNIYQDRVVSLAGSQVKTSCGGKKKRMKSLGQRNMSKETEGILSRRRGKAPKTTDKKENQRDD